MLDGKIGAIREKGSNLVLCIRDKESEATLLRWFVCGSIVCLTTLPLQLPALADLCLLGLLARPATKTVPPAHQTLPQYLHDD